MISLLNEIELLTSRWHESGKLGPRQFALTFGTRAIMTRRRLWSSRRRRLRLLSLSGCLSRILDGTCCGSPALRAYVAMDGWILELVFEKD